MKKFSARLFLTFTVFSAFAGCSMMNSYTVGQHNMDGVQQAIDCNAEGALNSLEQARTSEVQGRRRMSYVVAAAIYEEQNNPEGVTKTIQAFNDDSMLKDKDREKFLEEASCFKTYLAEKRQKKSGQASCGETDHL